VSESETGRAPPESVLQRILSLRINTSIIITTHEMMVQAESDITAAAAVRALNRLTPPCNSSYKFTFSAAKTRQVQRFAARLLVGGCDHKIPTAA